MSKLIRRIFLVSLAILVFSAFTFAQQMSYTDNLGVITSPSASGSNEGGTIGGPGSCTLASSSATNATLSVNYPSSIKGYGGYSVSWTITAKSPGAFTGYYKVSCTSGTSTVTASISGTYTPPLTTYPGLVYPKYLVVGVTYAPPGTTNYAEYQNTASIGTTTTYSSAFSNDAGYSVSSSIGYDIKGGSSGTGGGVTWTSGYSTDYTQTETSSNSITSNTSVMNGYKISGYPTTVSPSGTTVGTLPNDWDLIWVWVNPELYFIATEASGNTPSSIQWNGYGYDPADEAGPDIYPVPAGCLNGDFLKGAFYTANPTYCNAALNELERSWVYTSETEQSPTSGATVTAPGCNAQTAQSPSICPNTQDAYNILASDPLAYNPGGSTYTDLNSDPLPTTTADKRFTQFAYPPNAVPYEYGDTDLYSLTQANTQSESEGGSTQLKQQITLSEKVSEGFLTIWQSSVTYTLTDTITQTNTWLTSLSTSQTDAESFSIEGSNPSYVAPEFIVFQDNQYGTMMFYPNN